MIKTTTPAVDAIGAYVFEGNIIPHAWYKSPLLRKETGKPHLLAILILADILYWYRPKIDYNAESNEITGYLKKFHADKLQKSYQSYADLLGFTKVQVKRAFDFLRDRGLITIDLRTVRRNGLVMNNVLYVEPIPENVHRIMVLDDPIDEKVNRGSQNSDEGVDEFIKTPPHKNVKTNTETTYTQNTPENTHKGEGVGGTPSAPSARRASTDNQTVQAIKEWLVREVDGNFKINSPMITRTARALAARVSNVGEFNSLYSPEIRYINEYKVTLRDVRARFGLEE